MSLRGHGEGRPSGSQQSQRLSSSDSDTDFVPVHHKPTTKRKQPQSNKIIDYVKKKQPVFSPDIVDSTRKVTGGVAARASSSAIYDVTREAATETSRSRVSTRSCSSCNQQVKESCFSRHVINCLGRFKFEKQPPARSDPAKPSDEVCPICFRNIRHLEVRDREVHINRCIDSVEELPDLEEPAAPAVVMGCPYCGHVSSSITSRTQHVKRCSKSKGIGPERVLQDMQLLQRQKEELRKAGLFVPTNRPQPAPVRRARTSVHAAARHPQTATSAELQLAKAVSLSLFEEEQKRRAMAEMEVEAMDEPLANDDYESDDCNAELVRALGISAAPRRKDRRRGRKAVASDGPNMDLLLCGPERRAAIIEDRASRIVAPSPPPDDSSDSVHQLKINWKLFVDVPPLIAPLDRPKETPLWDYTSSEVKHHTITTTDVVRRVSVASIAPGSEDEVVSTQALFELFDSDGFNHRMQREESLYGDKDEPSVDEFACAGFFSQKMPDRNCANLVDDDDDAHFDVVSFPSVSSNAVATPSSDVARCTGSSSSQPPCLAERLIFMVGESTTSDAYIAAKDGNHVPCHTQLLYANCRPLFDAISLSSDKLLDWADISAQSTLAFLQFAYAGTILCTYSAEEMLRLACRYKLHDLRRLVERDENQHIKLTSTDGSDASGSGGCSSSENRKSTEVLTRPKTPSDSGIEDVSGRSSIQPVERVTHSMSVGDGGAPLDNFKRETPTPDSLKTDAKVTISDSELFRKVEEAMKASLVPDIMAMVTAQFALPAKDLTPAVNSSSPVLQPSPSGLPKSPERTTAVPAALDGRHWLTSPSPTSSPDIFARSPSPRKVIVERTTKSAHRNDADSSAAVKVNEPGVIVAGKDSPLPSSKKYNLIQTSLRSKKLTDKDSIVSLRKVRVGEKLSGGSTVKPSVVNKTINRPSTNSGKKPLITTPQKTACQPEVTAKSKVSPEALPSHRKSSLNTSSSSAASSDSPVFVMDVKHASRTSSRRAESRVASLSQEQAAMRPPKTTKLRTGSEKCLSLRKGTDEYSPLDAFVGRVPEYVPLITASSSRGSGGKLPSPPEYVPSRKTDSPSSFSKATVSASQVMVPEYVPSSSASSGRSTASSPVTPAKVPEYFPSRKSATPFNGATSSSTLSSPSVSSRLSCRSTDLSPTDVNDTASIQVSRIRTCTVNLTNCERDASSRSSTSKIPQLSSSHSHRVKSSSSPVVTSRNRELDMSSPMSTGKSCKSNSPRPLEFRETSRSRPVRMLFFDGCDNSSEKNSVSSSGGSERNRARNFFAVERDDDVGSVLAQEEYVPEPAPPKAKKRKHPAPDSDDIKSQRTTPLSSSKRHRGSCDPSYLSELDGEAGDCHSVASHNRSIPDGSKLPTSDRSTVNEGGDGGADSCGQDNNDVWDNFDDGCDYAYENWFANREQEESPLVLPYSPGQVNVTSTPKLSKRGTSDGIAGGVDAPALWPAAQPSPASLFSNLDDSLPDLAPVYVPTKIRTELTDETNTRDAKKVDKRKVTKKSACSPMPHYSMMETPEVTKHLKKVGVRKLNKKAAVKVLKHIFTETHPDFNPARGNDANDADDNDDERARSPPPLNPRLANGRGNSPTRQGPSERKAKATGGDKVKPRKRAAEEVETGVLNETISEFLRSHNELYHTVLQFKPIDITTIHDHLKSLGIKCKVESIKDYLDQECVAFVSPDESPGWKREWKKK